MNISLSLSVSSLTLLSPTVRLVTPTGSTTLMLGPSGTHHPQTLCSQYHTLLTEDLEAVGDQAGVASNVGGHTPVLASLTPEHGAELQPGRVADQSEAGIRSIDQ